MSPIDLPHSHHDVVIQLSRRGFLGRGIRFSIAVAAGPACVAGATMTPPPAHAKAVARFTHGTGLCNMPLFYAAEKKLFAKYGVDAEVGLTVPGTSTIQVASGQV